MKIFKAILVNILIFKRRVRAVLPPPLYGISKKTFSLWRVLVHPCLSLVNSLFCCFTCWLVIPAKNLTFIPAPIYCYFHFFHFIIILSLFFQSDEGNVFIENSLVPKGGRGMKTTKKSHAYLFCLETCTTSCKKIYAYIGSHCFLLVFSATRDGKCPIFWENKLLKRLDPTT